MTRPRFSGIDFARFIALIGMMAAHVWIVNADQSPGIVDQIAAGKAAGLFAVLAGVGISLTSRRALTAGRNCAARWNLFGRGLALIVIGLTLGLSASSVIVILVYYGVVFWVTIPLLRWSSGALLIGAGALAAAWPFMSSLLRAGLEQPSDLGSASWLSFSEPLAFVRGLFLTGAYPVPTWIVYVMVGMVAGRLIMSAIDDGALRRLGLRMTALGATLATAFWGVSSLVTGPLGGFESLARDMPAINSEMLTTIFYGGGMGAAPPTSLWWLATPAPHTGTTFDLGITVGVALAVLGACLALGTVLSPALRRVLEPIRRAGSAPLTVYVVHVIATAIPPAIIRASDEAPTLAGGAWYLSSGELWALHITGAIIIGAILLLLHRRGPLETLVSWTGRTFSKVPVPRSLRG